MSSIVDGLPFKEEKKKYILDVLDPILEEMVSDVLTEMPSSPLEFMIAWLRKRSGAAGGSVRSVQELNKKLKQELQQCTSSLEEAGAATDSKAPVEEEEEEEDEDDDCDELPESFRKPEAQLGRARQSVSAEAYGTWNTKKAFQPPSHPKTEEQKGRLNSTLMKNFMFAELEQKDMDVILMAMKEVSIPAGSKIITEGDDGDFLFVIESGSLDCIKNDKVVKTCNAGDVFGELALLYNTPRAASVVAKDACICWQLDRETVNHIVKDAAVKRRSKYDTFLKSVALISGIGAYERSQIADALKAETYKKGDVIVRQDDPGDKFYIVEDGNLYALKDIAGEGDRRVMDYKAGDYFGELALLKNQPRAASVIVSSDTAKVLCMSRTSFSKMLGPLQHLLQNQVNSYR
jgi:cAMP-dependent protein kinase regulator